jgi:hypothetical protein
VPGASTDSLQDHLRTLDAAPLERDVDTARVGAYRGYTEMVARWLALASAGARIEVIGHSAAGAPLVALGIGDARAPVCSAVLAGIHPIEWIGVETMLALLERLVAEPPSGRQVIAFPLINVDGYRAVEADLRAGRRRWRRGNDNRVDLNRNWPTYFQRRRALARRRARSGRSGPRPLSEPETAALVAALDRMAAHAKLDIALSLHSIGRMILFPFGGRWRPPHDLADHRRAAHGIQGRLRERYHVRQVSHWLPGARARGIEIDHLHERYGAVSLLVECSRGGLLLRDPSSWTWPFRWYNPPEPRRVASDLAQAMEPFVRGRY